MAIKLQSNDNKMTMDENKYQISGAHNEMFMYNKVKSAPSC